MKLLIFQALFDARKDLKRAALHLLAFTLFAMTQNAHAQSSELVRWGSWTIDAPVGGCGSLPLLQVKGPGALFEVANAAAFTGLQEALEVPLAKVCPGVTEVILANGRSRKLIRIKAGDAVGPLASTANPGRPTPLRPSSTQALQAPALPSVLSPPVLPLRSTRRGLSSAHGQQAKCDVLFDWLELSKESANGRRTGTALSPQALEIFRDDTMTAVFGKPYEALDNGARIELAEKVFAPCDGEARRPAGRPPITRQRIQIGTINLGDIRLGDMDRPLPPEYRQEFAQYTELIHEAFAGHPGRFEPAAINQFLEKIREQIDWANTATGSAAHAPATLQAYLRIHDDYSQAGNKAALLRPNERDLIGTYFASRQSELAPAVVQSWLAKVATAPAGVDSANALLVNRRQMGSVLDSLSEQQRTAAEATLARALDAEIAPVLQTETAKLGTMKATWQGAQELGAWEAEFLSRFGQFSASASYTDALAQFDAARSLVYPTVLPEWRKKVVASQLQSRDIANLRDQLRLLFVSPSDRALPMFQRFEQPVRDRQAQLDARVAEDEHRRLMEAEHAAAAEALKEERAEGIVRPASRTHADSTDAASLSSAGALKLGSGPDSETLNALYEGNFEKINLDRSSIEFEAIGGGYIEGFSEKCSSDLPADRVEIMRTQCDSWWVTSNVYGMELSRTCNSSHQEGTGVFADPKLYAALHSTPIQSAGSALRSIFDILSTKGNPLAAPIDMAVNLIQLKNDAHSMVTDNACNSAALKRFQKNLQLFALGKEGIRRDGTVKLGVALLPATDGTKYRDSDYARMLDDMVSEQGKTWAVNRYVPGSIGAVKVDSRDSSGRPAKISANYAFNGFSAREVGTVSLAFEEGRPSCLYFSDQPLSCRTPTHRFTTAYVQGEYR